MVRDIFVLCCFTGLAYVDIQSLHPDEIYENEKGGEQRFRNPRMEQSEVQCQS